MGSLSSQGELDEGSIGDACNSTCGEKKVQEETMHGSVGAASSSSLKGLLSGCLSLGVSYDSSVYITLEFPGFYKQMKTCVFLVKFIAIGI